LIKLEGEKAGIMVQALFGKRPALEREDQNNHRSETIALRETTVPKRATVWHKVVEGLRQQLQVSVWCGFR